MAGIGQDADAFESFYREHVDAVLRYATRRTRDPHAAADLTADIFMAAINAADGYRKELGSPVAWLYGIARNVVAAERRRAARAWAAENRIAARRLLDEDDIARLEERIDAERDCRALLDRIAKLPAGQQAVLELIAVDGLTLPEAAAALDISTVTARVRLHRARRALRDQPDPAPAPAPADPVTQSISSLLEAR